MKQHEKMNSNKQTTTYVHTLISFNIFGYNER